LAPESGSENINLLGYKIPCAATEVHILGGIAGLLVFAHQRDTTVLRDRNRMVSKHEVSFSIASAQKCYDWLQYFNAHVACLLKVQVFGAETRPSTSSPNKSNPRTPGTAKSRLVLACVSRNIRIIHLRVTWLRKESMITGMEELREVNDFRLEMPNVPLLTS